MALNTMWTPTGPSTGRSTAHRGPEGPHKGPSRPRMTHADSDEGTLWQEPLRDLGYSIVAAVRYRVFGKDDGATCRRMTKALRARFQVAAWRAPRSRGAVDE